MVTHKDTAIITGGAQGIGLACAKRLAANGSKLVLLDTDEAALTQAKDQLPNVPLRLLRCLIPWFDGAIYSLEWKEALWDKFVMGAPRPRTPSEQQYSDRKLRTRR